MEGCKEHTNKGHRENLLKIMKLRHFRVFQGIFGELQIFSGHFQGDFGVFAPMPFPGMPFGPFFNGGTPNLSVLRPWHLTPGKCQKP